MARHDYDKSSKWMLQKQGKGILYLGGARDIVRCSAKQAEFVQTRRLPDGLLEVYFKGRNEPDYFLVEIATYPEQRVMDQVRDDLMIATLTLGVLPEILTIVLASKGQIRITGRNEMESRLGWTRFGCNWKVVELWNDVTAADLFAANDVGVIPWVPLTHHTESPETILTQCRERIEQLAHPDDQATLLSMTQVLAQLRYPHRDLLALLGGKKTMIESPLIEELVAEGKQDMILELLKVRFGMPPIEVINQLRTVQKSEKLNELNLFAANCPDLEAFRAQLFS